MSDLVSVSRPLRAIQQIQIGSIASSSRSAHEVLAKLKSMGFEGIELNGFMTRPTSPLVRALTRIAGMPIGRAGTVDWASHVRTAGLSVVALHEDLGTIEKDPDGVSMAAASFGTRTVVVTGMYRFDYTDEDALTGLAGRLNSAGRALHSRGLRLLYHNHTVEFRRMTSGDTVFEVLLARTDPDLLGIELDCYWAATAGANPLELMQQLDARIRLIHITDRGSRRSGPSLTPIDKIDSVELGQGNLDIGGLIHQATAVGVEAIILETHRNWINRSPLRSAELSAGYLKNWLV
ncbi:sugar phosphate isomerase/epimerase family protein [Microbacterium azadirachtae]|jgi:sugar phosphate isomerase/epimerase|uniref:sugar phosphate isomerase/epimerase family protein n=1 Tax=Microbacterium azadirachtae TaxID=582680 RepID=UPI003F7528FC